MENGNGSSGWYDTSDNRQWYRQYSTRLTAPEPEPEPKKKRLRPGTKAIVLTVCVLILVAATAVAFAPKSDDTQESLSSSSATQEPGSTDGYEDYRDFFDSYYTTVESSDSQIERAETGADLTVELQSSEGLEQLTLQALYESAVDSTVGLSTTAEGLDGYYWGTGIIISEDGYILTNAHLVEGAETATVTTTGGEEYDALLVGMDAQTDLAVLKIEATGLKPASFGNSSELQVGDEVAAIGNPLSAELSGTMTNGIVSAISRNVEVNGYMMTLIQTNAAINEGNSGGPLLNMYGQVIGVTNMKMVSLYSSSIEGIGFAIPSVTVKAVADSLIASGEVTGRPGIGITGGAIPDAAKEAYRLPDGVYVSEVNEASDAWAQGIRVGDVITAVNGVQVASIDDINSVKEELSVGDVLELTVYRYGESFTVSVTLMDMSSLD